MEENSRPRCYDRPPFDKDYVTTGGDVIPARWLPGCRILAVDKETLGYDCRGCRWDVDSRT